MRFIAAFVRGKIDMPDHDIIVIGFSLQDTERGSVSGLAAAGRT
jgi:hypothetical protein